MAVAVFRSQAAVLLLMLHNLCLEFVFQQFVPFEVMQYTFIPEGVNGFL